MSLTISPACRSAGASTAGRRKRCDSRAWYRLGRSPLREQASDGVERASFYRDGRPTAMCVRRERAAGVEAECARWLRLPIVPPLSEGPLPPHSPESPIDARLRIDDHAHRPESALQAGAEARGVRVPPARRPALRAGTDA